MKSNDIVLGMLMTQPRTGYEINEILKHRLSYFFDGTYGMIYPTLKRLENKKMIVKETIIQDGKPNKNVYSITDSGKKEFEKYLKSDIAPDILKSDTLMRLYFAEFLDKDEIRKILSEQLENKKAGLEKLQANYKKWKENGISAGQEFTVKFGIAEYKAAIEVLEDELKNY